MIKHYLNWRWFMVAAIVGTILNLINQYGALFGPDDIHYPKFVLTYLVPYFVSSISAWYSLKD